MSAPVLEIHLTDGDASDALHRDVRIGLSGSPKWLPPKWFYDARGSDLFEQITDLPEYYPFRTERELLGRHAAQMASRAGANTLVELGSGSSVKTRLLLDALTSAGGLRRYVPLDVSHSALQAAAQAVAREYPSLAVHGVVSDFTRHLDRLPGESGDRRLVAFLGGTIGNLFPDERHGFLSELRSVLDRGEAVLIGVGLVIEVERMVRAYDDAAGVTAEFNRNVLHVLNRELEADFEPDAFSHVAVWDADREWIEMRLRAEKAMDVRLPKVDMAVRYARGELMRTEISAKFRIEGFEAELRRAGFTDPVWWTDDHHRFGVVLATAR